MLRCKDLVVSLKETIEKIQEKVFPFKPEFLYNFVHPLITLCSLCQSPIRSVINNILVKANDEIQILITRVKFPALSRIYFLTKVLQILPLAARCLYTCPRRIPNKENLTRGIYGNLNHGCTMLSFTRLNVDASVAYLLTLSNNLVTYLKRLSAVIANRCSHASVLLNISVLFII